MESIRIFQFCTLMLNPNMHQQYKTRFVLLKTPHTNTPESAPNDERLFTIQCICYINTIITNWTQP